MNDEITVVEKDPLVTGVALDVCRPVSVLAQGVPHGVRDCHELALVGPRDQDEEIREVGRLAQVEDHRVFGLLGLRRSNGGIDDRWKAHV